MRLRVRSLCALVVALGYLRCIAASGEVDDGGGGGGGDGMRCWVGGWRDVQAEVFWGGHNGVCWISGEGATITPSPGTTGPSSTTTSSTATEASTESSPELDTDSDSDSDSPLDNTRFLSFEEWKKQNLAKAGQSAENVGGGGSGNRQGGGAGGKEGRKRPGGVNNALDALGDEAEIELEFGGFVAERPGGWVRRAGEGEDQGMGEGSAGNGKGDSEAWGRGEDGGKEGGGDAAGAGGDGQDGVPRRGVARGKDSGTTCPERFNFASFDCAATVLKTNPECSGSSSVLIENKDSYMLNECGAKNKFLILELCDDILVDTIVLANYEFFSSIFRSFKVSVSDRYPAKPDQWKELGMYEARNSREIQAFAVENPLIWARYLRIEFLTHYGNEFYCPVSLIRVHGTTMMEEYKHDGEVEGRLEEDVMEAEGEPGGEVATVQEEVVGNVTADGDAKEAVFRDTPEDNYLVSYDSWEPMDDVCLVEEWRNATDTVPKEGTCAATDAPSRTQTETPPASQSNPNSASQTADPKSTGAGSEAGDSQSSPAHEKTGSDTVAASSSSESSTHKTQSETAERSPSSASSTAASSVKDDNTTYSETPKTSTTPMQPPPANPTTQESFFKSVNKRLHSLESNSSLSLMYIEEQSRILREAFDKMEKRQLAKTSTFLGNLNVTVLNELREFRQEYDNIWQSMVMEFEYQRQHHHREVYAVTAQLGILADELVFQKRISVIQSIFVLVCFVLVLFSRGSVGSYIDLPRVQSMVMSRSQSFRSSSPPFDSPSSTRPASSCRENGGHTRDSSEELKDVSSAGPSIAYLPPTPTSEDACSSASEGEHEDEEVEEGEEDEKAQTPHSDRSNEGFRTTHNSNHHGRDRSPSLRPLRTESSPSMLKGGVRSESDELDGREEMVTSLLKPSDLPQSPPSTHRKLGARFKGGKRRLGGNG